MHICWDKKKMKDDYELKNDPKKMKNEWRELFIIDASSVHRSMKNNRISNGKIILKHSLMMKKKENFRSQHSKSHSSK